jgi:hypothetical protein
MVEGGLGGDLMGEETCTRDDLLVQLYGDLVTVTIPRNKLIMFSTNILGFSVMRCLVCDKTAYFGEIKHMPGCVVGEAKANAKEAVKVTDDRSGPS